MLILKTNKQNELDFLNKIADSNLYPEFILGNILNSKLNIFNYSIEELNFINNKYIAKVLCTISGYNLSFQIKFNKVYYDESLQIELISVNKFSFVEPIKYNLTNFKYVIKLAEEQHLYASYLSSKIFMDSLNSYENLYIQYDSSDNESYIIVQNKESKNALKLFIADNFIYVSNLDNSLKFLNYLGFTHLANQDFVLNVLLKELNDFGHIYNYKIEFLGGESISNLNNLISKIYNGLENNHYINIFEQTYQIYYKDTEINLDYEATIRYDEISKQFVLNIYLFGVNKFFVYETLEEAYMFETKVYKTLYGG